MKRLKVNFEFSDKRGKLIEVWRSLKWKRMNYLFCKKGSVRGGHYHKKTNELFFVVDGRCEVTTINVKTHKRQKLVAGPAALFLVEPYETHIIKALRDSKIIALLDSFSPDRSEDKYLNER